MPSDRIGSFAPRAWVHAKGVLNLDSPRLMGVVNVTPDSFSDGGRLTVGGGHEIDIDAATGACRRVVSDGADIVDVGGESTRPGAPSVAIDRELERVAPVLAALGDSLGMIPISVDTRRSEVARVAIELGASIINDVSCLADHEMARVVARSGAGLVIGHLRGEPRSMQTGIRFVDLLREVTDELAAAVERALDAGVERPRIVVDPGIGFGKSAEQSSALVAAAGWLRQATGCAVMIGASRKSFLGAITQRPTDTRLAASLAAAVVAVERGASVIRVHDVKETVDALRVAAAIRRSFELHADGGHRGGSA